MFPKLALYLTLEGQEAYAKGNTLYSWHFAVSPGDTVYDDELSLICLAKGIKVVEPHISDCVSNVLAKLSKKEAEIQAEAHKDILEVKKRRDDLLMLGHEAPKEV